MHHKNQLMDDDSITYLPYLRENVEVGAVSSYDGLPRRKWPSPNSTPCA